MKPLVQWETDSGVRKRHRGSGLFEINRRGPVKINGVTVASVRKGDIVHVTKEGYVLVNGNRVDT